MRALHHRYQIHERLGEGGMGEVLRATDRLTGATVALKRVLTLTDSLGSTADTDLRLALAREFQMLATLRHPHIIEVIDYGFDVERYPFFTMTLLERPTDLLRAAVGQPFSEQVALVVQVLQALVYLHQRGILHRDLKPSNILVHGGQVKVVDFGVSVPREQAEGLVGTIAYMTPEILRGERPNESADLYAVGVMLFELLEGRHPFNLNTTMMQLIQDIIHLEPHFTPTTDPVRHAVQAVALRLMAKSPDKRYLTAREAIRALCHAADFPQPPESEATREAFLQAAQFVGRETEFTQLQSALQAVHTTHNGAVWLIGGESGVGKSRLVYEVATTARVAGWLVLEGQAVSDGGTPYQIWREPLRRLVLVVDPDDQQAAILKAVVPDIAALLGRPVPDAPPLASERATKERLIGAIVDLFSRLDSPTLLMLEDFQWVREGRDALLAALAVLERLPLLVVITYRHEDDPTLPTTLPTSHLLKLERLSPPAVADLTTSILGQAPPEFTAVIERETEGNVLFIVEILRALAQEAGSLQDVVSNTLPMSILAGGIDRVLQRRLKRLDPRYWHMLQLAAIWGRQLDLTLLAAVGPADYSLETWLGACADAAILEVYDAAWRFSHDKLREWLITHLEDDKADLYRQAAEVYEACYPDQASAAATLADYWQVAGDPQHESHYREQAAAYCGQFADFAGAIDHSQRLLDLLPPDDHPRLAEAYLQVSGYRRMMGDYEATTELLEQAAFHAQQTDDHAQLAWITLRRSQLMSVMSQPAKMLAFAEEALTLANAHNLIEQRVEAYKSIGWASLRMGRYPDAHHWLSQALVQAENAPDLIPLELRADILNDLAGVCWSLGDYDQCAAYLAQCIAIRRTETRNTVALANALGNLARIHITLGNAAAAVVAAREGLALIQATSGYVVHANKWHLVALAEYMHGNLSAASAAIEQSLTLYDQLFGHAPDKHDVHHIEALTTHLFICIAQRDWTRVAGGVSGLIHKALLAENVTTYAPILLGLVLLVWYRDADAEQAALWLAIIEHDPTTQAATLAFVPAGLREALAAALPPTDYQTLLDYAKTLTVEAELRRLEANDADGVD